MTQTINYKSKFGSWIRVVSLLLSVAFLCQDVVWSCPHLSANRNTLAQQTLITADDRISSFQHASLALINETIHDNPRASLADVKRILSELRRGIPKDLGNKAMPEVVDNIYDGSIRIIFRNGEELHFYSPILIGTNTVLTAIPEGKWLASEEAINDYLHRQFLVKLPSSEGSVTDKPGRGAATSVERFGKVDRRKLREEGHRYFMVQKGKKKYFHYRWNIFASLDEQIIGNLSERFWTIIVLMRIRSIQDVLAKAKGAKADILDKDDSDIKKDLGGILDVINSPRIRLHDKQRAAGFIKAARASYELGSIEDIRSMYESLRSAEKDLMNRGKVIQRIYDSLRITRANARRWAEENNRYMARIAGSREPNVLIKLANRDEVKLPGNEPEFEGIERLVREMIRLLNDPNKKNDPKIAENMRRVRNHIKSAELLYDFVEDVKGAFYDAFYAMGTPFGQSEQMVFEEKWLAYLRDNKQVAAHPAYWYARFYQAVFTHRTIVDPLKTSEYIDNPVFDAMTDFIIKFSDRKKDKEPVTALSKKKKRELIKEIVYKHKLNRAGLIELNKCAKIFLESPATGRDLGRLNDLGKDTPLKELLVPGEYYSAEQIAALRAILNRYRIDINRTAQSVFTDESIEYYVKKDLHDILMDEYIESFYVPGSEKKRWVYGEGGGDMGRRRAEMNEINTLRRFFREGMKSNEAYDMFEHKFIENRRINLLDTQNNRPIFDAHASPEYGINICSSCKDRDAAIVHEFMAFIGIPWDRFNEIIEKTYIEWRDKEKMPPELVRALVRAAIAIHRENIGREMVEQDIFNVTDISVCRDSPLGRIKVQGLELKELKKARACIKNSVNEYVDMIHRNLNMTPGGPSVGIEADEITAPLHAQINTWLPRLIATLKSKDENTARLAEACIAYVIDVCATYKFLPLDKIFVSFQIQGIQIKGWTKEAFERAYITEWTTPDVPTDYLSDPDTRYMELTLKNIAILALRAQSIDNVSSPEEPVKELTGMADAAYKRANELLIQYFIKRARMEAKLLEQGDPFILNIYAGNPPQVEKCINAMLLKIKYNPRRFKGLGIELTEAQTLYLEYLAAKRRYSEIMTQIGKGEALLSSAQATNAKNATQKALARFAREMRHISVAPRDFAKFRNTPAIDVKEAKRIGIDFVCKALELAAEAKRNKEKIIIAEDTSWIPQAMLPQELLNGLCDFAKERGLDNIVITRSRGTSLADEIDKEIGEAAKQKLQVPARNIIIIGKPDIIANEAFNKFRNREKPEEGAFFAGVELPKDISNNNYLAILDTITLALKLAFDKNANPDSPFIEFKRDENNPRSYHFTIKPYNLQDVKATYDAQVEALKFA